MHFPFRPQLAIEQRYFLAVFNYSLFEILAAILSIDRSIMTSATISSTCIPRAQILPVKSYDEKCNIISNPAGDVGADDSFASYLAVVRDNLQAPAAAAAAEPHNVISSAARRPTTPLRISLMTRKRVEDVDNEIDIFSAEMYFSGSDIAVEKLAAAKPFADHPFGVEPPMIMRASAGAVVLPKSRSSKWAATGTGSSVCGGSETSSGNSRSVLLQDRGRRQHVGAADIDGGCGGVFHLGGLGFWCSSCSRKSSVKVNKLPSSGNTINNTRTTVSAAANHDFFYEQKHSWRSPVSWRIETAPCPREGPWLWAAPQVSSSSLASSSSSLARRGLPPPQQLLGSSLRRRAVAAAALATASKAEEDARSESSSELFEIESVSFGRADAEATTYEPSEASIDWSVVTASAANVSVASYRSGDLGGNGAAIRRSAGLQGRKSSTAGILGCASHKAVEVVSAAEAVPRRAAGGGFEIKVGTAAEAAAGEAESSISPVVARYHVELEAGGGSGRIVAGRSTRTSWESFRSHQSPLVLS